MRPQLIDRRVVASGVSGFHTADCRVSGSHSELPSCPQTCAGCPPGAQASPSTAESRTSTSTGQCWSWATGPGPPDSQFATRLVTASFWGGGNVGPGSPPRLYEGRGWESAHLWLSSPYPPNYSPTGSLSLCLLTSPSTLGPFLQLLVY